MHTHVTHFYIFYVFSMDHRGKKRRKKSEGGGQKRHAAFLLPSYIQFITVYYTFYKKWVVVCRHRGITKGEQ